MTTAMMTGAMCLGGCGGQSASSSVAVVSAATAQSVAAVSVTPAPAATPTPTPTPSSSATTGDLTAPQSASGSVAAIPASIASNFDAAAEVMAAWETGVTGAIPPGNDGGIGAFRFVCMPGPIGYDDPIVFPGQPGKSHLHQFFGNTGVNASSTYASLRTSGDSTCMNKLNRSGYWMPAMLNGKGQVVRPDYVTIYYKRPPEHAPNCMNGIAKDCVAMPRGLRFAFGYDMVNKVAGQGSFICDGGGDGQNHSLTEVAKTCPVGAHIGAVIDAPNCWDGKNLDTPDHRSHVVYMYDTHLGFNACPADHPYIIPTFTLKAWYAVAPGDTPTDWYLSSDDMTMPDGSTMRMAPGSTLHSDWFGAWDDATLQTWNDNCLNKMLNCSGGDLGNGTQLRQTYPLSMSASPHLVAVPARPS